MCRLSSFLAFIFSTARHIFFRVQLKMSQTGPATWICPITRWQAMIQTICRPGMWFSLIKRLHSHKEKWTMPSTSSASNTDDILRGLMTVMQSDKTRSFWFVKKAEKNFVQVQVFTRFEWLDVMEFKINGSSVEVSSFSTGLLPLWIPLACLINMLLFWIPFCDFGLNKRRITGVVEAMDIGLIRT